MHSPTWKPIVLGLTLATTLSACGGGGSDDNPTPTPTPTPSTSPTPNPTPTPSAAPEQYEFKATVNGADAEDSAVSYTGQTARHVLIADMSSKSKSFAEGDASNVDQYTRDLTFYLNSNAIDTTDFDFSIEDQNLLVSDTSNELKYGSISSSKNLAGKIAGGSRDPKSPGEVDLLIGGEFFGWKEGLEGIEGDAIPIDLVNHYIDSIVTQATDSITSRVATANGDFTLETYHDSYGRDYQQLLQKFLLGAVTFSQGTNDYLSAVNSFSDDLLAREGSDDDDPSNDKPYSVGEHEWDEAFGYFGAARDYGDYTDNEIAQKDDDRRAEYANGYHDSNGDGLIDLRSEYNFGNSTNCAKRDRGSNGQTNYTKDAFDAFIAGRKIMNDVTKIGPKNNAFTDEVKTELGKQIKIAAVTWEKCIAATVVHYINDTITDLETTVENNGAYSTEDNDGSFANLAKHWSEMKGFALGLQFSPYSPFRTDDSARTVDDLKNALELMQDAPVLADGTLLGKEFDGGIAQYTTNLLMARDIFQDAYGFDADVVKNW